MEKVMSGRGRGLNFAKETACDTQKDWLKEVALSRTGIAIFCFLLRPDAMANQLAYRPETPPHPDRLWLWEKHVYLDEFRRSWLPIVIKSNGKFQVIMRQKDVILGDSMTPSQLVPYELPLMWQLYPEERYRSSNSEFWQIVYHIKFKDDEDMLLELLDSE
uniref:Tcl1 family Akt coactivator A n=2 Tax=Rattus norvegicus TaxID=10116 RepID=D3ZWG3_RAT